jgi:hypothetical protein
LGIHGPFGKICGKKIKILITMSSITCANNKDEVCLSKKKEKKKKNKILKNNSRFN